MLDQSVSTLAEQLQLLWMAVIWSIVTLWIAQRNGLFSDVETERQSSHLDFTAIIFIAGTLLFVWLGIPAIVYLILAWQAGSFTEATPHLLAFANRAWVGFFISLLLILSIWVISVMIGSENRKAIWGERASIKNFGRDFLTGVLYLIVCYPLVAVLTQSISIILKILGFTTSQNEQVAVRYLKATMDEPWLFLATVSSIVVFGPIMEEFIFRGVMQTWLKQNIGKKPAIIIASLIFAFFHYSTSQGIDNILLLSALFLLACFLGFVYERQRSLWASISLHAAFNGINVIALMYTQFPKMDS